jgi:hypothetical protein
MRRFGLNLFNGTFITHKIQYAFTMNIATYTHVHKLTPTQLSHISELESLALRPKRINGLNDNFEMENLVNNIKQTMFQDYKSAYDVRNI